MFPGFTSRWTMPAAVRLAEREGGLPQQRQRGRRCPARPRGPPAPTAARPRRAPSPGRPASRRCRPGRSPRRSRRPRRRCGWLSEAACWASARNRARKLGSPVYSLRSTFTATEPVQGDVRAPPDLAHAAGGDQLVQLVPVAQAPSSWFDQRGSLLAVRSACCTGPADTRSGVHTDRPRPLRCVHSAGRLTMVDVRAGPMVRCAGCDPRRSRRGRRAVAARTRATPRVGVSRRRASGPTSRRSSRTPGGQAKTADDVCRMYSFIASSRRLRCTGTNPVSGSRWKAMKNSPASSRPSPSEPSTKL